MRGTNDGEGKERPLNQFQEKARRNFFAPAHEAWSRQAQAEETDGQIDANEGETTGTKPQTDAQKIGGGGEQVDAVQNDVQKARSGGEIVGDGQSDAQTARIGGE